MTSRQASHWTFPGRQKVAWIDRWIERANQKETAMGGRLDEERRRRREDLSREQAELADLNTRWAKL